MKNRRIKILSLAAALALSTGMSSLAETLPFSDIQNSPNRDAIVALYDQDILHGIGNGLYAPAATLTSAQAIQLIVNALDLNLDAIRFIKAPLATDYFEKADNDAWYAQAMIIAAVHGLEFSADTDPNAPMTKEAFTYILIRAIENQYELPMLKLVPRVIADEAEMNVVYSGAVQRALVYGVIALDDQERFQPTEVVKREDAAAMVAQAMDYAQEMAAALPQASSKDNLTPELKAIRNGDGYSLEFTLTNIGDDVTLTYPSGQRFNYQVYDAAGNVVYNWEIDKMFLQALMDQPLAKGEALTLTDDFGMTNNSGEKLPQGSYRIVFESTFYLGDALCTISDEVNIE